MVSINFRRQQLFYGAVITFAAATCGASATLRHIRSQDLASTLANEYNVLRGGALVLLETNLFLAIFALLVFFVDVLRKNPIAVWLELVWTSVAGLLEIIAIVILSKNFPHDNCHPATTLSKRDHPGFDGAPSSSVAGDITSNSASTSVAVCQNSIALYVLLGGAVAILYLQFAWLIVLGLRHLKSHPDWFHMGHTPAPFTWRLPSSDATKDDVSSVSDASSICKKADLAVPAPQPVRVRWDMFAEVDRSVC